MSKKISIDEAFRYLRRSEAMNFKNEAFFPNVEDEEEVEIPEEEVEVQTAVEEQPVETPVEEPEVTEPETVEPEVVPEETPVENPPAEVETPVEVPEQQVEINQPQLEDTRDLDLVNKLLEISGNISNAINDTYGVQVQPGVILADLVQDLNLISGKIKPEELAETPANELTKKLYASYKGFNDFIDALVGQHTSSADRLKKAIALLDTENFQPEGITKLIASPEFIQIAQEGEVPGISIEAAQTLALPTVREDLVEKIKERKPADISEEEYLENARAYAEEIKGMDKEQLYKVIADYDFDNNPPVDEAEQIILDAINARQVELDEEDVLEDDQLDYDLETEKHIDEIMNMDLDEVNAELEQYDFENNEPEDGNEELIYQALTARKEILENDQK